MQKTAHEQIADVQMGFMKGVGTRDQIFNLRIIMEKANEASVPLFIAFVDYKKSFLHCQSWQLCNVFKRMGLNGSIVDIVQRLYENQQAAVRVESEITDWFKIGKGVRQGCLISPLSFNCYSEHVMRESADEFTWIGVTIAAGR